jgi:hypothetical protein
MGGANIFIMGKKVIRTRVFIRTFYRDRCFNLHIKTIANVILI